MKIENRKDAFDSVSKLKVRGISLCETLGQEYDVDENDFINVARFVERLSACLALMTCESTIAFLVAHCVYNNEDENFEVQREINFIYQKVIIREMELLANVSTTWEFIDYRLINFQKDIKEIMDNLVDFYSYLLNMCNEINF